MPTKYIRNQSRFLVFPESLVHREMAINVLGRDKLIHGAGFLSLSVVNGAIAANCHGESESLRVGVRRDDHTAILKSIGVKLDESSVEAKYVVWRHKMVIFSNELEFEQVIAGSFYGAKDINSAGTLRLNLREGKIEIVCSEAKESGVTVGRLDVEAVADLFRIPVQDRFI